MGGHWDKYWDIKEALIKEYIWALEMFMWELVDTTQLAHVRIRVCVDTVELVTKGYHISLFSYSYQCV